MAEGSGALPAPKQRGQSEIASAEAFAGPGIISLVPREWPSGHRANETDDLRGLYHELS